MKIAVYLDKRRIMNTAKELRSDIMELLFKIDDIRILNFIRTQLEKTKQSKEAKAPAFMEAVTSIKEDMSLEEMMKQQNYHPINYNEYKKKVADIKWEESLDDLLGALTK